MQTSTSSGHGPLARLTRRVGRSLFFLCRHGCSEHKHMLKRLEQLTIDYMRDIERYYRPASERCMLSAKTLYEFPEAIMLAQEARFSIQKRDYKTADEKIVQALAVLQAQSSLRWHDMMNFYAAERRAGRNPNQAGWIFEGRSNHSSRPPSPRRRPNPGSGIY